MGNAFFRWEASDTDAAVDTMIFIAEDPRAPHFRLKHASVGTIQEETQMDFRFYSRYIFLRLFSALQLILGLFILYIFNYMGTIRYYYSQRLVFEHEYAVGGEEIGRLYLAIASLGIFFIIFITIYIIVINSKWWISLEMKRWVQEQQINAQREIISDSSISPNNRKFTFNSNIMNFNRREEKEKKCNLSNPNESNGCRLRRLGVRWISSTRPYYTFPSRYLSDFDYRHDLHMKYGARATQRDPHNLLFIFVSPLIFILFIIDIIVINDMRMSNMQVSILHGLLVACGPLFLLYVVRHVLLRAMMCGKTCYREMKSSFRY